MIPLWRRGVWKWCPYTRHEGMQGERSHNSTHSESDPRHQLQVSFPEDWSLCILLAGLLLSKDWSIARALLAVDRPRGWAEWRHRNLMTFLRKRQKQTDKLRGHTTAQVSRSGNRVRSQSSAGGVDVDKVTPRHVSPQVFGFSLLFSFHKWHILTHSAVTLYKPTDWQRP
jgi:hypothetical protein